MPSANAWKLSNAVTKLTCKWPTHATQRHAASTRSVANQTIMPSVNVYLATSETLSEPAAIQNVRSARTAHEIRHASTINARIHALESAGMVPNATPSTTAPFVRVWTIWLVIRLPPANQQTPKLNPVIHLHVDRMASAMLSMAELNVHIRNVLLTTTVRPIGPALTSAAVTRVSTHAERTLFAAP